MAEKYKSVEQRLWDGSEPVIREVTDFSTSFIETFYGVSVTPLRVPTFIRKLKKGQSKSTTFFKEKNSIAEAVGGSLGLIGGVSLIGVEAAFIAIQAGSGDYLPLYGLIATNLISGGYELGSIGRDKQKTDLENSVK